MTPPLAAGRGLFLTVEGPEGAGKSTHARRLYETLRVELPLVLTREPGGTPLGEAIRAVLLDERHRGMRPEAEMLLFAASRAQLVAEVILPALAAGTCVLSERFVDASIAYQGYGRGLPVELVRRVNEVATQGLRPDLTLLIDIEPHLGLQRARGADGKDAPAGRGDRLEQEDGAFHARVREGFLELAREDPGRFVVVNGALPRDDVHRALLEAVRRLLRDRGWSR
ncbi:MAG: dTMP kinase [Armatimonadota bacterium]|nr:dTMP kinase [Armatimonadota bacterium]MDR7421041.1 dTMP kinase [Armatimonadota bacterium]MDR7453616.1 dTMP kinase [Armatimonadota bacterium]MDR7456832.1 dTMP kinase [Armatimonadota bacterium]MDR7495499.1 dTMP kinase [Armatimonadota bacterium]